jgi:hypothetical protein
VHVLQTLTKDGNSQGKKAVVAAYESRGHLIARPLGRMVATCH